MPAILTVNFTAGCTGGCTQEYRYVTSGGDINGATVNSYSGSSPLVISGLTDGQTYTIQLRNVCGPVKSAWTSAQSVLCIGATPTPTPTPTPTATAVGPTPTPTPTPTATPESGNFILDPQYGLKFSNLTGTGLPTFTFPVTGGNTTVSYTGTITAQNITLRVYGVPTFSSDGYNGITLSVGGSAVDCKDVTEGSTDNINYVDKVFALPQVTAPTTIRLSVASNACPTVPQPTATPTPTPTPVSTTKFIVKKCLSSGGDGVTSYKVQIAPNATVGKSYTLYGSGAPADMDGYNCWYVDSTVTDTTSPDYSLNYNGEYASCGLCSSVELVVYTGNSLSNACSSSTTKTLYYRGTLGVGTVLYTDENLATIVETPGYYKAAYSDTVYHVGVASQYPYIPSPEDGYITDLQECPTPTPTPTPIPPNPTVHVYEKCPEGSGNFYWRSGLTAARAIDASNNCYIRKTSTAALLTDQQMVYPSLTENPDLESSTVLECPCE